MDIRSYGAGVLAALFLLILSMLLPQPVSASQDFMDLIIDTGNAVGDVSLAGADACTGQAFNEVKTALRKGRLSGGGEWIEEDEGTTLQGACPGSRVAVFWFKRSGNLLVRATLGCGCTGQGPLDLERGAIRFLVPVLQTQRPDGGIGYRIGTIGEFTVEAECCLSRRAEPQLSVFDSTGVRKAAGGNATGAGAATPPTQANRSDQNPCPVCEQDKQIVDYFAERLAKLDVTVQATREVLDTNTRKLLQAQHRIDDIDTRLDDERGSGGESYDPHTGITVRSYDQAGGKVKVETLDPDGRIIDSYSYPRRTRQALRLERVARETEVQATEDEGARLRVQLATAQRARDKTQADLEQVRRELIECELRAHPPCGHQ